MCVGGGGGNGNILFTCSVSLDTILQAVLKAQ